MRRYINQFLFCMCLVFSVSNTSHADTVVSTNIAWPSCNVPAGWTGSWATAQSLFLGQCSYPGLWHFYASGYSLYGRMSSTGGSPRVLAQFFSLPSCPEGTTLVDGVCKNQCEPLAGNTSSHNWDYLTYGDNPTFCSQSCELKAIDARVCFLTTGRCSGTVRVTGNACSGDTEAGGNIPDEVPQGCQDFNGTYLCPKDANGDGQPDAGQPLDTDSKCGYDGNDQFSCSGGSYAEPDYEMQDPTKPLEGVESTPVPPSNVTGESVEGVTDPNLESDERQQILQMNRQINALLQGLNDDNNKNFKQVIDELKNANQFNQQQLDQIVASTNKQLEIWDELKTLQKTGFEDTINAIGELDDYDQYYHDQMMAKQNELLAALNGLSNGGESETSKQILDKISNVTASVDGSKAVYTSPLDDATISNQMVTRLTSTKDKIFDGMLSAFGSVDLSGAARPSFALDMSGFGFGKYDFGNYVNFDYIFGFIRICILFTAAVACRKIIFGG